MKRKIGKICAILLGAVLLLGNVGSQVSAITFESITSDSIKDKQNQIAQAKNDKKNLQNGLTNLQQLKKDLEKQKKDLSKYIVQLDANLAVIEEKISQLKLQITAKEGELEETQKELDAALLREGNQKDSIVRHIRMVYEEGYPQVLEMFSKAQGLGDLLNLADYVEKIITYEKNMLDDFKMVRQYVELCKEELEWDKALLDDTKAAVETEQKNLEDLIEQKNKDLTAYELDIATKAQAIKDYQEEIKAEEEEIKMLEAMITAEKKNILANSGIVLTYDGGQFKMPLAYYSRISSEFGNRIHPTLGIPQFHNGVDFASPKGTAIYAAYDGVVVAATYSSTMGNYVMIDHGDNLYTIYMHASALHTKEGEIVVRGERIASVGSTGRSTGNHLHFTVRKDGEYVSPWDYLNR